MDSILQSQLKKLIPAMKQDLAELRLEEMKKSQNGTVLAFNYEEFISRGLEHLGTLLSQVDCSEYKVKLDVKDNQVSTKLREDGNNIVSSAETREDYVKALEYFTESIANALPGSLELAHAYARRSSVLLLLKRPNECLEDIKRVLKFKHLSDKLLKAELQVLLADCFEEFARDCYMEAKTLLDEIPLEDCNRKILIEKLKDFPRKDETFVSEEHVVPELSSPNANYPCASDAVDVRNSRELGRQVVATRDIEIGEILLVEKPYSMSVSRDKHLTNCANCLKFTWDLIPCDRCVSALYCSDSCKETAWKKYHQINCVLTQTLYDNKEGPSADICVRVLLDMIREAGGLRNLKQRVRNFTGNSDGYTTDVKAEWYQKPSLESILTLETNVFIVDEDFIVTDSILILKLIYALGTNTNLFGFKYNVNKMKVPEIYVDLSKDVDAKFVGGLLSKLFLIGFTNEYKLLEEDSTAYNTRGSILNPFLSLINHSCATNTYRQYKQDCVVLHAIVPIKRGEQITTRKGIRYETESKADRQRKLRHRYCIWECKCIACTNDWPISKKLESAKKQLDVKWFIQSMKKCQEIEKCIEQRNLSKKDEMLHSLYEIMKGLCEKIEGPSQETFNVLHTIERLLAVSGNSATIRKKITK